MAKKQLKPLQIELYQETEEGRAYLEYNKKVGGEPIGLTVPYGYPKGVKEKGWEVDLTGKAQLRDDCARVEKLIKKRSMKIVEVSG